jgi:WD40 repeat protein
MSVAFDTAGRRIVSGSFDNTVRVWDAESGHALACLRGHEGVVTSVAFDAVGRRIVSGSQDKTVRVWDAESGRALACLRGHESSVRSVAFDAGGRRIVSGSWDDTVRVWDADRGVCLEVISGKGDVLAIAAGAASYPWRALRCRLETVIERASDGQAVAWFPAALHSIVTHASGRIWAGSVPNHLYLIRLEGPEEG